MKNDFGHGGNAKNKLFLGSVCLPMGAGAVGFWCRCVG